MNTKVLPNEIRRLLNQPRQLAYLLGLVVVIALGAVLFLTVLRVQNQKSTIDRPQAADACPSCCATLGENGFDGCSDPVQRAKCSPAQCSAADKWKCSKEKSRCAFAQGNPDAHPACLVDNCRCGSDSIAACGTGGGGGNNVCGGTEDPSCVKNCVDNIRVGNCSYCKSCCGTGGGNCTKTSGGGGTVKVLVKKADGSSYDQSGTIRMTATSACSACNSNCADPVCNPNREKSYAAGSGSVSWADSSKGATYNFVFVGVAGGSCTAPAGGSCTITVGGGGTGCQDDSDCTGNKVCVAGTCTKKGQTHFECVSNACARVAGKGTDQGGCTTVGGSCSGNVCQDTNCPTGQACFNNICQAYHLGCDATENTCARIQGVGQNGCSQIGADCGGGGNTCVDSQCATGQACFGGSCKAYHFGCTSSNVCAKLEGAGTNTSGCVAAGQVCGGELGSCWGNGGVNGRCVDCNGDGIINILDFSCLACNWSEKFTPDQNPSCRTTSANE